STRCSKYLRVYHPGYDFSNSYAGRYCHPDDLNRALSQHLTLGSIVMLRWAVIFLVIAIIAAILGFGGLAGTAAGIAEILFYVFLILFVISLIFGRRGKR